LFADNFHRTALINNDQVVNSLDINFCSLHNRNFLMVNTVVFDMSLSL
jgi:hypothetical protein